MTGLLSLTSCHLTADLVCPQPLSLAVEQNPLAAYLLRQAPMAVSQVASSFTEFPLIPTSALNLTVLSSHRPHCSSVRGNKLLRAALSESSLATSCGLHATPDY